MFIGRRGFLKILTAVGMGVLVPPPLLTAFSPSMGIMREVEVWNDVVDAGQGGFLVPPEFMRELVWRVRVARAFDMKEADNAKGFSKFRDVRDKGDVADHSFTDFVRLLQSGDN